MLKGGGLEGDMAVFLRGLKSKLKEYNSAYVDEDEEEVYETMADVNSALISATNNGRDADSIRWFLSIPSVYGWPKDRWKATLRELIREGLTVFNSPIMRDLSVNTPHYRQSRDDPASGEENEEPEDAEYSVPASAVPYRPDGGL